MNIIVIEAIVWNNYAGKKHNFNDRDMRNLNIETNENGGMWNNAMAPISLSHRNEKYEMSAVKYQKIKEFEAGNKDKV
jgi:hypothetical protein